MARFDARQCKVKTVGVYGLSTDSPSMPEAPYRSEKPGVGGSSPPLTTSTKPVLDAASPPSPNQLLHHPLLRETVAACVLASVTRCFYHPTAIDPEHRHVSGVTRESRFS